MSAKPNAKHAKIEKISGNHYTVAVTELAKDGKANTAIIKALSDHLDIPKSRIAIKSGQKIKTKIIEIL